MKIDFFMINTYFLFLILVGGIYTVIRSKAYVSTEEMGDQYILIGPYKEACARTEVEEIDFPSNSPLNKAVQIMREQGFKVEFIIVHKNNFLKIFPINRVD